MTPPSPYDGAWVPCPSCDDYWCLIHDLHVHDCPCPPVEDFNPPEAA